MLICVGAGVALAARVPWQAVAVVVLAVIRPLWFLAGAVAWALLRARRRGRPGSDDEAAFLRGLAAELSAGASLRGAVVAAAGRAPALSLERVSRLCAIGRPSEEIGSALGEALPVNRVATTAAFRLAMRTGGAVAPVFEALAERAEADGRLGRERSALTAQVRLSAWVVGGVPAGLVALGLVTGTGPDPGGLGPEGTVLAGTGLGLIGLGALAVWWMVRGSGR